MAQKMQKAIMEELDNETLASFDSKQFHDIKVFHGVEKTHGRRFIRWRFSKGIDFDLTAAFMQLIKESVSRSFYMKYVFQYQLRNIENDDILQQYYAKDGGSPWINKLENARKWLREREKVRLDYDSVERPDTKWVFEGFLKVDVKVVLDNKPLLGGGPLPDWLRNLSHGRNMFALDSYNDNLCLWRCMAVHNGARPDRCTSAARLLAMSFFKLTAVPNDLPKTSLDQLNEVEKHLNLGEKNQP